MRAVINIVDQFIDFQEYSRDFDRPNPLEFYSKNSYLAAATGLVCRSGYLKRLTGMEEQWLSIKQIKYG